MAYRHAVKTSISTVVFAASFGSGAVQAQSTRLVTGPPKAEPQVTVDLAEVGLAGSISAVRVTIAPGTMTSDHTHTGRTSIFVILEGALTEVRGNERHEYRAGDVVTVAEGVTHHAENYGTVPVIYIELNTTANNP